MTAPVDQQKNTQGGLAFAVVFGAVFILILLFQMQIANTIINTVFPSYTIEANVFPMEWIIMTKNVSGSKESAKSNERLLEIYRKIAAQGYDAADSRANVLGGKFEMKQYASETSRTLYFINPYVAFFPLYLFISFIAAFLFSVFAGGGLGLLRGKIRREYERLGALLRKQYEAHKVDFDATILLPEAEREVVIRQSALPDIVTVETGDFLSIREWVEGRTSRPIIPLRFYFRYRISTAYGNLIQGLVSGGAGILIFVIGLRGLKLIPSEEPSIILMALSIEFILLMVLMLTFMGSAQEERLDRIVKELEAEQRDAINEQTASIQSVLHSAEPRSPGRPADSIADYEERRIVDEVLSLLIRASKDAGRRHES